MKPPIIIETRDQIAIVTLNMPEKRNALGTELYVELSRNLQDLQDDQQIRALVLHGGRHFCSGGDLAAMQAGPLAMRTAMQIGHRAVRALTGGRLPAVAAVEGVAYGAGLSLAMACDFVVTDEETRFCAAFGRVGLTPDYGLMWTLPQRVGIARTRELLMLCSEVTGRDAVAMQLADRLVPKGQVLDTSIELAKRLATAPPGTISTTKAVLARLPLSLDTILAWEADTQSLLARTQDVAEGIQSFAQRRNPRFKGD